MARGFPALAALARGRPGGSPAPLSAESVAAAFDKAEQALGLIEA